MSEKFFPELARRLRQAGITTGPVIKNRLPVLLDGQEAMWVDPEGYIIFVEGATDDPKAGQIYCTVRDHSFLAREYTDAMASAPILRADGLDEGFRLLAEYNGVVLAGQELDGDWGYKFVTWLRTPDRAAVVNGNYYHNDYDKAKLDFACRSGLVQDSRQFTDEQLTELYRCIHETLDSGYPITRNREDILRTVAERIEDSIDDLEERVELSNQRELEYADRQEDSGPGMEMAT